jgi:pimeloyl-ACP methyl ester carboxylesterase
VTALGGPVSGSSPYEQSALFLNRSPCQLTDSGGSLRARANCVENVCPWSSPCWYLLGTQDRAIPPALQRFMAERATATIVEVAASHVSFVSQPEAATQLILQAVETTAAAR